MDLQWPTPEFLEELKVKAHAMTRELLSNPGEEYEIDVQRLQGSQLQDLVVEFNRLSVVIQNGRPSHYFRVSHHIGLPPKKAPLLPLFQYEVEFSPAGEVWDDFFDSF
jgi:hypothetical protein